MRSVGLTLVGLLLVSASAYASTQDLTNTDASVTKHKGPESPDYKVLNRTAGLEIREYDNATWAVSFGRSRFWANFAAIKAGFGLAKYFSGGNVEHESIERTVPLLATILRPPPPPPKNGSHHGALGRRHPHPPPPGPPAVAVAGFIPKSYKGEAPLPESCHVKILHTNETKVYVHEFGGWFVSWVIGREIRHLIEGLRELEICPGKGIISVAAYDGPWKFFGRRNELWWAERPKSHHSNTTMSFGDFEVDALFPEEYAQQDPGSEDNIQGGTFNGSDGLVVDASLLPQPPQNTGDLDFATGADQGSLPVEGSTEVETLEKELEGPVGTGKQAYGFESLQNAGNVASEQDSQVKDASIEGPINVGILDDALDSVLVS